MLCFVRIHGTLVSADVGTEDKVSLIEGEGCSMVWMCLLSFSFVSCLPSETSSLSF